MTRRCLCLYVLLAACAAARSGADEPAPAKTADPPLARRLWAVTELVLDHHVDPPARQQMLLAGVKELLAKANKPAPRDLGRRLSGLTTLEQFEALLKELHPAPTPAEAEEAVLEGMLAAVPGRAHFFNPEGVKMAAVSQDNNYVGTGIQIRMDDKEKLAQIMIPFAGGPFRRAGGRAQDLIVEVDGQSMAGKSMRDVVTALRGGEGTTVTALVRQPGSSEKRLLNMVREVIPFQSAVGYRRVSEEGFDFHADPNLPVAFVRLTTLSSSTYHELRRLERQLRREGYCALVLDLRGTNPGTVVHAAQVADALLDGGLMWKVRDTRGRVTEYKADRYCLFRDWPVAVLVDELTVETPAVIAEALQDRGRAVLVGSPTPAGGTVRSLVPLPDGTGGVNLQTGFVERVKPAKQPGVKPDHVVEVDAKRRDELLKWYSGQESPEPPAGKAPADAQLTKALELLRDALNGKKDKAAG